MWATYGIDVLDPTISLRRVHVLARRLPPGALPRVPEASWSSEAHLLARLNDAVDLLIGVMLRVNRQKAERPKPLARPTTTRRARGQKMSWGQLARSLGGGRTNGG